MSTRMEQPFITTTHFFWVTVTTTRLYTTTNSRNRAWAWTWPSPIGTSNRICIRPAAPIWARSKLASPELERLIIQNSNGVLTTPTRASTSTVGGSPTSRRASRRASSRLWTIFTSWTRCPRPTCRLEPVAWRRARLPRLFWLLPAVEPPIYTTLNAYCPQRQATRPPPLTTCRRTYSRANTRKTRTGSSTPPAFPAALLVFERGAPDRSRHAQQRRLATHVSHQHGEPGTHQGRAQEEAQEPSGGTKCRRRAS